MLVNWSFISQLEGGRRLMGYVPCPESGQRGVTVATGVDLGSCSPSSIDAMLIPDGLKAKLKPYAGLKGEAAAAALDAQPLGLTSGEAEALEEAVKKPIVQQVVASYDAAVQDKESLAPFKTLPEAAQTVIASVALKHGPDLPTRIPRFWDYICAQDWPAAVAELEQYGSARHEREADLLKTVYQ
jgi:hypothetical protein